MAVRVSGRYLYRGLPVHAVNKRQLGNSLYPLLDRKSINVKDSRVYQSRPSVFEFDSIRFVISTASSSAAAA
jgi:hypothetical protein